MATCSVQKIGWSLRAVYMHTRFLLRRLRLGSLLGVNRRRSNTQKRRGIKLAPVVWVCARGFWSNTDEESKKKKKTLCTHVSHAFIVI